MLPELHRKVDRAQNRPVALHLALDFAARALRPSRGWFCGRHHETGLSQSLFLYSQNRQRFRFYGQLKRHHNSQNACLNLQISRDTLRVFCCSYCHRWHHSAFLYRQLLPHWLRCSSTEYRLQLGWLGDSSQSAVVHLHLLPIPGKIRSYNILRVPDSIGQECIQNLAL